MFNGIKKNVHSFRNPDIIEVFPHRDFMRLWMPRGRDGFTPEDGDLISRWFSPAFHSDTIGKLSLNEIKYTGERSPQGIPVMDLAQLNTFGLLDFLCRKGEEAINPRKIPEMTRYCGFNLIGSDDDDWNKCDKFWVNGTTLTPKGFIAWLHDCSLVAPYDFKFKAPPDW
jgi:hypothetical protein